MYDIEKAILDRNYDEVKNILGIEPSEVDRTNNDGVLMALLSAKAGDIEILKYIVEYSRASMNIYDKLHRNILHYGVMSGYLQVCIYLVE